MAALEVMRRLHFGDVTPSAKDGFASRTVLVGVEVDRGSTVAPASDSTS
jgi:hypothetical protein